LIILDDYIELKIALKCFKIDFILRGAVNLILLGYFLHNSWRVENPPRVVPHGIKQLYTEGVSIELKTYNEKSV
jgi:hypothetical protein